MSGINQVTISGRIGRDVNVKVFGDFKFAETSVAVDCGYWDKKANQWKKNTAWVPIKAIGKMADILASCRKGDQIVAGGKFDNESWVSKTDGKTVMKLLLKADYVSPLPSDSPRPAAQNGNSSSWGGQSDDGAWDAVASSVDAGGFDAGPADPF